MYSVPLNRTLKWYVLCCLCLFRHKKEKHCREEKKVSEYVKWKKPDTNVSYLTIPFKQNSRKGNVMVTDSRKSPSGEVNCKGTGGWLWGAVNTLYSDMMVMVIIQLMSQHSKPRLFFFLLFRATYVAYWSFQARGQTGPTAAGLHHSHSNSGSEPRLWHIPQLMVTGSPTHWVRPGIEPASSWTLVGFISAAPQGELPKPYIFISWILLHVNYTSIKFI